MSKKIIALVVLILIVVGGYFGINTLKNKFVKDDSNKSFKLEEDYDYNVTIMFDATGGEPVSKMTVKANEDVELPTTTREGYTFVAWFNGSEEVEEEAKFIKDVTLVAKWQAADSDTKTFRITYDTKGGSHIKSQIVECDAPLVLATGTTKDKYKFKGWTDKKGKAVTNTTKLECKDVTLYAKWEKEDTKGKKYTCPDGYTLEGDKCKIESTPVIKCPDGTYGYSGGCVAVGSQVRKTPIYTCNTATVIVDNNGHTQTVQGRYISGACYYYEFTDVTDSATCTSQMHKWVNGKCYAMSNTDYKISCANPSNYVYIAKGYFKKKKPITPASNGCYPISQKQATCQSGYVLTGDKCVKTIDATVKK